MSDTVLWMHSPLREKISIPLASAGRQWYQRTPTAAIEPSGQVQTPLKSPRPHSNSKSRRLPDADPAHHSPPQEHGEAVVSAQLIEVDAESDGQRIDNFLVRFIKGVPRSHLYRVLRRGEVRVNKGRVKASHRLQTGDLVRIPPLRMATPEQQERAPRTQMERIERGVLFEDERLLVIDKPSGIAVHGGSGLSFGLIESLRQARPGRELELVHRLDRETSGCLVISKRRSALRELHQLIRENGITKRYRALILGELPRDRMVVDAPLRKNVLQGGERLVRVDQAEGKPARTIFRRLRRLTLRGRVLTLVEAELITGRTHQIRVHAAHLGAPLAGDPKYGDEEFNRELKGMGLTRLFLHAASLRFQTEGMTSPLTVEAPLPEELERFLAVLENTELENRE